MTRIPLAPRAVAAALLVLAFARAAFATMPSPDGTLPPEVAGAAAQGMFAVPDHSGLRTTSSQVDWLVPVIMVNFADSTLKYDGPTLQHAIFDTTQSTPTGSAVDYWNWVSGSRIHLRGEVVATVTLPHPMSWYANFSYGLNAFSTPQNDWGLVRDAVGLADPFVDWNRYDRDGDGFVDMLWIVHAGLGSEATGDGQSFWSMTTAMNGPWSNGGVLDTGDFVPGSSTRKVHVNRFTMLPELSPLKPGQFSEIGVYCHEFGHALGLPDLYDTSSLGGSGNIGPGCWSLMASGGWGGDNRSPAYPTHPGAWCMLYLGLSNKVQPMQDTTMVLAPISSGGPVVQYWFQGENSTEHYLLEQRYKQGFDRNLPGNGILISQVDDAVIGVGLSSNRINTGPSPGLRVLEADGTLALATGQSRGTANDPVPGATNTTMLNDATIPALRTFNGAPTNLSMDGIQVAGSSTRVRLHVRAAGWYAIENATEPAYHPTMGFSRGRHAVVTSIGDEYETFSDSRSGTSQVMLRVRSFGGTWQPAVAITSSPAGAYDPTLALLPGDGLALAWSDLRDGQSQIYYRCRVGGTWSPEQRISQASGGSPAIAADPLGRVDVAWSDGGPPWPHIRFLSFPASAPGGTPLVVNDSLSIPSAPSIAATPRGGAWIAWPDLGSGYYAVQFSRWAPDSGVSRRLALTYPTTHSQSSLDLAVDTSGTVHVVWQQAGNGASEIHYQRRPMFAPPYPPDTTIVSSGVNVQNPSLFIDRTGAMHLAFESSAAQGQMIKYKRWRASDNWDYPATDVSDVTQGSAGRVNVLAVSAGDASVLYSSSGANGSQLFTRRRRLDAIPLAVGPSGPPAAPRGPAFRMGPSPLAAGRPLVVSGLEPSAAGTVDLYDATGRRVASAAVERGTAQFTAGQTRDLLPGLYFTRVRGGASRRLVVIR